MNKYVIAAPLTSLFSAKSKIKSHQIRCQLSITKDPCKISSQENDLFKNISREKYFCTYCNVS